MAFIICLVGVALAVTVVLMIWERISPIRVAELVCVNCGTRGEGHRPGSTLITLVLLCFFLVPGIIYWAWRASRKPVCDACDGALIPVDSPRGRAQSNA